MPSFGAAYVISNKGNHKFIILQKIVKFKEFSRPKSDFKVHFKADLIFKDFSQNFSIF